MESVVILVLLGAAWLWWRSRRMALDQRAEELTMAAADMEQFSVDIQGLQVQFTAAVQQGNYPQAIRSCEQSIALIDQSLNGDPELLLPMLGALANLHETAGNPEQSMPALQRSIALCENLPEQQAAQCDALARLAALHVRRGENRDAQRLRKREVELRLRHGMGNSAELLCAQCSLLALSLEESAIAELIRREIRETARRVNHDALGEQLNVAYDLLNQAIAEGRDRDAWPAAEDAALLAEALHGPEHDITFVCRGNLAEILRRNRQYEAADTQFRQLITQLEKRDAGVEGLGSVYGNMALLCEESGRSAEAAEWRQRQSALLQAGGASVSTRFNALNNLAVSHSGRGDEEAAAKAFSEALALAPEGEGVAPRTWAETMNNYGSTLVTLKRLPEAGRLYQKVVAQKKAGMAIPLPQLASSLNGLGMVYDTLGKLPQAQDMFERALRMKEKSLKPDDLALETAWHNLGSVCARRGDSERAIALGRLVLASREKRLGKEHTETATARMNLETVLAQQAQDKPVTRADIEALMVQVTGGELRPYATFDFGRARDESVSMVLVPESESLNLQFKLSRALPQGWRCHVGSTRWLGEEKHEGKAELVAIHAASQFDSLRIARTDAINHGMETEDVIRTLEDYHRRFGIRILAAETDSVEFQLLRAPDDVDAFAAELLEFCMDLEDVSLITPMLTAPSRLVSLWWD